MKKTLSWDYLFIHAMLSTSSIAKKPYLNEYTAKYAFSTTQNNRFIWGFLRLFKY